MAKTFGVTVREIVWTQGRYDIVTILDAPDESSFMSLTLSLAALGNVRTESLRAFSAAEMTKAVGKHALTAEFARLQSAARFRIDARCASSGMTG